MPNPRRLDPSRKPGYEKRRELPSGARERLPSFGTVTRTKGSGMGVVAAMDLRCYPIRYGM